MKFLSEYIERDVSIMTDKQELEDLYIFKDFPVFMGCVEHGLEDDLFFNMEWAICKETGMIQLNKLIPLEILYQNQHNDGIGKTWAEHYDEFSKFIFKYHPKNILEIGPAHDFVSSRYLEFDNSVSWIMVEPNPQNINSEKFMVIKDWFNDEFSINRKIDAVIHSHVLEHIYNPVRFLEHIGKFLNLGGMHIFSIPNLEAMLRMNFTNCLNFEHTVFITEYFVDHILQKNGFKIIEKKYHGNPHSIFYATEKANSSIGESSFVSKYKEYKKLFMNFVEFHKSMINDLNNKMSSVNWPIYLFGAHIFSQYLINFGLRTEKIVSVLDNSTTKHGKRLYGTNLKVESPKILKDKNTAIVILRTCFYDDEIKRDILKNINSNVKFW
jgi:SAM-dependent methyltransferase